MSCHAVGQCGNFVATVYATIRQRHLGWVEANGGIGKLVQTATQRDIHLVKLTDDKGNELPAASRESVETLC